MQRAWLNTLKARYRFDEWRRTGKRREHVFLRHYRVTGDELPDHQPIRNRVATLGSNRWLNSSTWERRGRDIVAVERPVVVDVFEHSSRQQADESLIELAGQFHLPVALNLETDEIGEVRLATPDGAWFAFVRGNVVVRIMSGLRMDTPVCALAERFDGALISKPSGAVEASNRISVDLLDEELSLRPRAVRLSIAGLEQPSEAPPEEEPCIKVFSRGGTVAFDEGFVFLPEEPEVEIEVFVTHPGGSSTYRRYQGPTTRWLRESTSNPGR